MCRLRGRQIGWKMILRSQLMLTSPLLEAKTYISCKHFVNSILGAVGLGWGSSSKGTFVSPWGLAGCRVFAVPSKIGGRVGLLCLVLSLMVWMSVSLRHCSAHLFVDSPTRLNPPDWTQSRPSPRRKRFERSLTSSILRPRAESFRPQSHSLLAYGVPSCYFQPLILAFGFRM